MFSKVKMVLFLFGIFFIIRGCYTQIPETTVAQYHYTIFKIFFDAALGPDASENSKTCPGICMPSSTAVFCPKVLDDIQCFTSNTKCCIRRNESEPADPNTLIQMPNLNAADITKSGDSDIFNASEYQNDPFLCPGYCILSGLQSDCESPAVIIPNTSNCAEDTICCDNTRVPITPKPTKRPKPRPTRPPTHSTTQPTYWSATSDTRPECPGICIANLIRFTCYGNAEVTDLFKCKRSTTTCCANKELVHEKLAQLYFNQPIPPHGFDTFLSHDGYQSHGHDSSQKYQEPESNESDDESELNAGEEYSCPGVCVADHFAGYCEAYLISSGLCEPGSRCCVSREAPKKPVSDSRLITKNGQRNQTMANPIELISMIINSNRTTSTVKPIQTQTTTIKVETESTKIPTPNLSESTIKQSSTESSSTMSSNLKVVHETTVIAVETESKEAPTLNTIESTTPQFKAQISTEYSSTTLAEGKFDQETETPILNNV